MLDANGSRMDRELSKLPDGCATRTLPNGAARPRASSVCAASRMRATRACGVVCVCTCSASMDAPHTTCVSDSTRSRAIPDLCLLSIMRHRVKRPATRTDEPSAHGRARFPAQRADAAVLADSPPGELVCPPQLYPGRSFRPLGTPWMSLSNSKATTRFGSATTRFGSAKPANQPQHTTEKKLSWAAIPQIRAHGKARGW